jgi:hypothetical protein
MGSIIIPPHPRIKYGADSSLSLKSRGEGIWFTPKQSFEESID